MPPAQRAGLLAAAAQRRRLQPTTTPIPAETCTCLAARNSEKSVPYPSMFTVEGNYTWDFSEFLPARSRAGVETRIDPRRLVLTVAHAITI